MRGATVGAATGAAPDVTDTVGTGRETEGAHVALVSCARERRPDKGEC